VSHLAVQAKNIKIEKNGGRNSRINAGMFRKVSRI
jgi:hypothetical protein